MTLSNGMQRWFAMFGVAACGFICTVPAFAQVGISFATTLPDANPLVKEVFQPWADSVNAAANGEFVITLQNGPTVASHTNVYERVNSGIIDMGWGILASLGAEFPRSAVSALPFLVGDSPSGTQALWSVYKQGLLDEDFAQVKLLSLVALPVAGLHSRVPITSIDDLKGTKVRAADKVSAVILEWLGATPVSVATAESYQAIEQGAIQGMFVGWTGLILFRLEEVTTEHLDVNLASGPAGVFMNLDTFSSLSPQAQAVLVEAGEQLVTDLGVWYGTMTESYRAQVAAMPGHTVRMLSEEEKALWVQTVQPVTDAWVGATPNGQAIYAAFVAALPK